MTNKDYFIQKLKVETCHLKSSRVDFLKEFVKDKNVLHVGFADYPITDISQNLHLLLAPLCSRIDGIDLNLTEEIKKILTVDNGNLFSSWDNIKDQYDVIIVPEVIEHVNNLEDFFKLLDQYKGTLIITAPDAYTLSKNFRAISENEYNFQEIVHPDHNCWFSPYTLQNVINKYSKNRKVVNLFWIRGSIAAVCLWKK